LCSQTTVEYAGLKEEVDTSDHDSPKSKILRETTEDDEESTALVDLLLSEGLRALTETPWSGLSKSCSGWVSPVFAHASAVLTSLHPELVADPAP